jgi:(p)ppGpp synthase/HD superfamily hydrolase
MYAARYRLPILMSDTISHPQRIPLSARFDEAMIYAHGLHARQFRKRTSIPYISHLLAVASIVLDYGGDEDEAIAALLHDAVEDQGGADTREAIRHRFGERVARIVDGCTDADTEPKPPWQERKEAYIAHVADAEGSVLLVSMADKLHNVRSILKDYRLGGDAVWERFKGGRDGSLWYYRALVEAYRKATDHPLLDELDRAVSELERLAQRSPDNSG